MPAVAPAPSVTIEDLLAMPEDGVDRWIIRGELREKEMTRRNRFHAASESTIAFLIHQWRQTQPRPRGKVYSGEVGVILSRNPESMVGVDVAYTSAEVESRQTDATTLIEGVPVLCVEISSPNDREEEVNEKIDDYLSVGVPLVWLVDPYYQTITVYRPDRPPEMVNREGTLSGDPHMPGFSVRVAAIFED